MATLSQLELVFLLALSFAISGIFTPLMRKIAIANGFFDKPNQEHKTHEQPIPYMGGVAIVLGVCLTTYSALLFSKAPIGIINLATSVLLPAVILALVGLIDDKRNLPPLPRFLAQNLAGMAIAGILVLTDSVGNPTGNSFVDSLITVMWVVGIANSINFFDNLDGAASGTVGIISFGLVFISFSYGQFFLSSISVTIAGSVLGFLLWNKSPARIYMGDAGSLFLGVMLATISLRLDPAVEGRLESFAIPIVLLAVPFLDTSVAVISRLRRRISPFQGGRDHLSHRLMRLGLTKRQSAYTLWSFTLVFVVIGVLISIQIFSGFFLVLSSVILWSTLLIAFLKTSDEGEKLNP